MRRWIWAMGAVLMVGGCGGASDSNPQTIPPDAVSRTYQSVYAYVVSKVIVPETVGHAMQVARDVDGDNKKENNLGVFFASLNAMAVPHGCVQSVNTSITLGKTIQLLEVHKDEKASSPAELLQQMGRDANSDPKDNLEGDGVFTPAAGPKAVLRGTLEGTALRTDPGRVVVPLFPQTAGGAAKVIALRKATFECTVTKARLTNGVVAGGVEWQELKTHILPGIASVLDCVAKNRIPGPG